MMMASIDVTVPEAAKQYVLDDTTELMRKALLIYPSIANETISHGKAAELLGVKKNELIELYSSIGIPYIDMTDEEFDEEISVIKRLDNL